MKLEKDPSPNVAEDRIEFALEPSKRTGCLYIMNGTSDSTNIDDPMTQAELEHVIESDPAGWLSCQWVVLD
jgi:hypothetical protein